jgi:hypothetical protein
MAARCRARIPPGNRHRCSPDRSGFRAAKPKTANRRTPKRRQISAIASRCCSINACTAWPPPSMGPALPQAGGKRHVGWGEHHHSSASRQNRFQWSRNLAVSASAARRVPPGASPGRHDRRTRSPQDEPPIIASCSASLMQCQISGDQRGDHCDRTRPRC